MANATFIPLARVLIGNIEGVGGLARNQRALASKAQP
jgi:hypothetical protein